MVNNALHLIALMETEGMREASAAGEISTCGAYCEYTGVW